MSGTTFANEDISSSSYPCQHGGPGELVIEDKKLFLLSYQHNLKELQKQIVRALYPQIVAAELVLLEEMITSNATILSMIDTSLVKLLFSMSTNELLQGANVEQSKIYARCAIYVATYLQYGEQFWTLLKESPETQSKDNNSPLYNMHVGVGQIATDNGLVRLLSKQVPCQCLQEAFPALEDKEKEETEAVPET